MVRTLLTLVLVVSAVQLFACSCMYTPMGINKIMRAEALVSGKIIDKSIVRFEEGKEIALTREDQDVMGTFKYTLKVKERVKGIGDETTIYFYSNMSSAACGVNYDKETELYVFLNSSNDRWFTSSCSGNIPSSYISDEQKGIIKKFKAAKGKEKWFNEYKKLEAEGRVKKGNARGKWKFYFADGTLATEGKYRKGKKVGKWKVYQTPANLPKHNEAINPNKEKAEPILESIEYYEKGRKIKTEAIGKKMMK